MITCVERGKGSGPLLVTPSTTVAVVVVVVVVVVVEAIHEISGAPLTLQNSSRGKPMCPAVEIWRRAQKCARHRLPRAGAASRRAEHLDRRPGVRGVEADLPQEERERRAQDDGGGDDEHARERDRALPGPKTAEKGG